MACKVQFAALACVLLSIGSAETSNALFQEGAVESEVLSLIQTRARIASQVDHGPQISSSTVVSEAGDNEGHNHIDRLSKKLFSRFDADDNNVIDFHEAHHMFRRLVREGRISELPTRAVFEMLKTFAGVDRVFQLEEFEEAIKDFDEAFSIKAAARSAEDASNPKLVENNATEQQNQQEQAEQEQQREDQEQEHQEQEEQQEQQEQQDQVQEQEQQHDELENPDQQHDQPQLSPEEQHERELQAQQHAAEERWWAKHDEEERKLKEQHHFEMVHPEWERKEIEIQNRAQHPHIAARVERRNEHREDKAELGERAEHQPNVVERIERREDRRDEREERREHEDGSKDMDSQKFAQESSADNLRQDRQEQNRSEQDLAQDAQDVFGDDEEEEDSDEDDCQRCPACCQLNGAA